MTLLQIVQAVADETNLTRPNNVIGNGDAEVQKMLRFANRIGGDLVSRGTWQTLRAQQSFTAVAGVEQAAGALPADFYRMAPETFWEAATSRFFVGPTDPVQWQSLVATSYTGSQRSWTRRGNALLVTPAMAGGEVLSFEYFSNQFCESAGGVGQARWTADSDVARLPEELFILGVVAMMTETEGDVRAPAARVAYEMRVSQEARNDKPTNRVMTADPLFGGQRHPGGAPFPDGQKSGLYGSWL